MEVQGGCLCGSVRYRSTAAPIVTRLCWCRVCQFLAAGNASVNVCFSSSAFNIEGALSDYRSIADSGNVMHRRFGPSCGTPMFREAESRPHLIFVTTMDGGNAGNAGPVFSDARAHSTTRALLNLR